MLACSIKLNLYSAIAQPRSTQFSRRRTSPLHFAYGGKHLNWPISAYLWKAWVDYKAKQSPLSLSNHSPATTVFYKARPTRRNVPEATFKRKIVAVSFSHSRVSPNCVCLLLAPQHLQLRRWRLFSFFSWLTLITYEISRYRVPGFTYSQIASIGLCTSNPMKGMLSNVSATSLFSSSPTHTMITMHSQ